MRKCPKGRLKDKLVGTARGLYSSTDPRAVQHGFDDISAWTIRHPAKLSHVGYFLTAIGRPGAFICLPLILNHGRHARRFSPYIEFLSVKCDFTRLFALEKQITMLAR